MKKVLAQEEIDALFGGEGSTTPDGEAESFNFSRAGQITNEQMRAIATVHDLFARNLMRTIGAWLRTECAVNLVSGERMAYSEFVDRIPETTYVCSLRLEPLAAIGLMEVELSLASPMVDLLLGGTGRTESTRALTDIEDLILVSVIQVVVKELNLAWVASGLEFHFEKREAAAQISRVMPAGEKTICVCFEVTMPEAKGMLTMCLPAVVLNTILRKMIAEHDRTRRSAPDVRARISELLGRTTVGAVLQFPVMRLQARDIMALAPESVLRLPLPRHTASEFRVAGQRLSLARPVKTGEHRGARLEAQQSGAVMTDGRGALEG